MFKKVIANSLQQSKELNNQNYINMLFNSLSL